MLGIEPGPLAYARQVLWYQETSPVEKMTSLNCSLCGGEGAIGRDFSEIGSLYVAQDDFKFVILPQLLQYWGHRYMPLT